MSPRETGGEEAAGSAGTDLHFGDFAYDRARGVLLREGEEVDLPPRALGVLELLLDRAGELVTREVLESALWEEPPATQRSLNEAVMQLRRALGDDSREPDYVQTVHRRGYRFIAVVRAGAAEPARPPAAVARRRLGAAGLLAAGAVLGLVAGAVLAPLAGTAVESGADGDLRVQLALDAPLVPDAAGGSALAVSPDGSRLAYVARSPAGGRQLRLLELGGQRSRLLEGTEGRPRSPFFSPDGRWVGYFAGGFLWRVATTGGEPLSVCRVPDAPRLAGTWTGSNDIVFSRGRGQGLWSVPAYGGDPVALTSTGGGGRTHLSPHAVPGASLVVYAVEPPGSSSFAESRIDWVDVHTGAGGTMVQEGGGRPRASRSGLLVFVRDGALVGSPVDLAAPRPLAMARTLISDLRTERRTAPQYDLAADGTLVYVSRGRAGLRWLGRQGGSEPLDDLVEPPRRFALATTRPDLALERDGDLDVLHLLQGAQRPLVHHPADDTRPLWGPDGETLYFSSNRRGAYDIYRVVAGRPAVPVVTSRFDKVAETLTPDGSTLVFSEFRPGRGVDLWKVPVDGSRDAEAVLRTPFQERQADLSPDGRWLAYVSDEVGADRVSIRPWEGPGPVLRIPRAGARMPRWSRDGDELFFLWLETLWVVRWPDDVAAGLPSPTPASLPGAPVSQYAVDADARRFLAAYGPGTEVVRLQYLEDWAEDLVARLVDER